MLAPDGNPERRDIGQNSYAYMVARIMTLKVDAHCTISIDLCRQALSPSYNDSPLIDCHTIPATNLRHRRQ